MTQQLEFKTSNSSAGQIRLALYGSILAGVAISGVMTGFNAWVLASGALAFALACAFERAISRKAPKVGDLFVSLRHNALESPHFSTKRKRYLWSEIVEAKVVPMGGIVVLQLQLTPSADRPNKRAFLDGANPSKPFLSLQGLTPSDQERLLDAVLAQSCSGPSSALQPDVLQQPPNDLTLARQLQERLKALAPTPWVCVLLVATNVLAWLVSASLGTGWTAGNADKLYAFGGNAASAVQAGETWRLITAPFLHAHLLHLLLNMLGLWVTGVMVERLFGRSLLALIYFSSAVAGGVASLYFSAQSSVSVGASGAVFGVAGALLVAVFQERATLPRLFSRQVLGGMTAFVGYSLLMGFGQAGVDNAAHVGGLLTGLALGLLLPTQLDAQHRARVLHKRMLLALLMLAVVLPWAALRVPVAAVDIGAGVEARKAVSLIAQDFDAVVSAIKRDAQAVQAGQMGDRDADDRSRTVHAPSMQAVVTRLKNLSLEPNNPSVGFVADLLALAQPLHEHLAMDSVLVDGKMQPADAEKGKQLQADIQRANDRMLQHQQKALVRTP